MTSQFPAATSRRFRRPFGTRANAIAPSIVWNEKIEKFIAPKVRAKAAEGIPLGRIRKPEDVARTALFLASENVFVDYWHTLDINGGI